MAALTAVLMEAFLADEQRMALHGYREIICHYRL